MSLYRRLVLLSCLSWPLAGFSATALDQPRRGTIR